MVKIPPIDTSFSAGTSFGQSPRKQFAVNEQPASTKPASAAPSTSTSEDSGDAIAPEAFKDQYNAHGKVHFPKKGQHVNTKQR